MNVFSLFRKGGGTNISCIFPVSPLWNLIEFTLKLAFTQALFRFCNNKEPAKKIQSHLPSREQGGIFL